MWTDLWLLRLLPLYGSLLLFQTSPISRPTCDPIGHPIWPRPESVQNAGDGKYWQLNTADLRLIINASNSLSNGDWNRVQKIMEDAQSRYRTMIPSFASARPDLSQVPMNPAGRTSDVHIVIDNPSLNLNLDTSESYEIMISVESGIHIHGSTVFGALRALQTLAQLVEHIDYAYYVFCADIHDSPAYPYRGLMIDTSRHFLSVEVIARILDGMEVDKLNVLHWHVSDDQSFPFQSESNPDLIRSAYSSRMIYSTNDVQRLARLALMRGIRIVPEFDTPGHSASFGVGYPNVMAKCPNVAPPNLYMINPVKKETRELVSTLLQEAVNAFGDGDLIHLGGDEVDTDCLIDSQEVQSYMKEHGISDPKQLLADYQTFLQDFVGNTLNRTAIVWQEVFDSGLPLSSDTIVDVWYNPNDMVNVIQSGHRAILSSCWYLDHLGTDWRMMYACDPAEYAGPNEKAVLGGHACMWGEKVDDMNAISRIWPRASSVAERLWTRQEFVNDHGLQKMVEDRLDLHRCRMISLGIGASPVRPGYCRFQ